MNFERACRELVAHEEVEAGGMRFDIARTMEGRDIIKRIRVKDAGGEHHFTERVHAFAQEEVEAMIERAGLRIFDRTDGPVFTPFDPDGSERLVIWAQRPA
jgi:hypothetical protein